MPVPIVFRILDHVCEYLKSVNRIVNRNTCREWALVYVTYGFAGTSRIQLEIPESPQPGDKTSCFFSQGCCDVYISMNAFVSDFVSDVLIVYFCVVNNV